MLTSQSDVYDFGNRQVGSLQGMLRMKQNIIDDLILASWLVVFVASSVVFALGMGALWNLWFEG